MNNEIKSYDHAWNYFQFHGNQRMTTFNFFVGISSLVAAGSINLIANPSLTTNYFFVFILGILQMYLAFLFWKLDKRVSIMIKFAEKSLKFLEDKMEFEETKIISNEDNYTEHLKTQISSLFWKNHYSYSKAFKHIFLLFGGIGSIVCLYSLFMVYRFL